MEKFTWKCVKPLLLKYFFLVYTTLHCQSTDRIRIQMRWKLSGSDQKGPDPQPCRKRIRYPNSLTAKVTLQGEQFRLFNTTVAVTDEGGAIQRGWELAGCTWEMCRWRPHQLPAPHRWDSRHCSPHRPARSLASSTTDMESAIIRYPYLPT